SRVSSSLLHALGLPELICADLAAYEQRATELAHDPTALDTIRDTLARRLRSTPVFDTRRFVRHLEAAYGRIWKLYVEGRTAEHVRISERP
ncbi:MAG: hypothetical protein U9P00_11515, partial [Pseudomonadota bacterium]|nr:hypothetical protein [Pseudomonadota bacterium]